MRKTLDFQPHASHARPHAVPRLPLAAGRQGPQRPSLPRGAALLRRPQHHLAGAARPSSGTGIRSGSASGASAKPACSRPSSTRSLQPAAPRTWFKCSTPPSCGRMSRRPGPKGGRSGQALGRSRGGFSTKIHLKADFDGRPLAFHLTEGEAERQPAIRDPARPRAGHHAARGRGRQRVRQQGQPRRPPASAASAR